MSLLIKDARKEEKVIDCNGFFSTQEIMINGDPATPSQKCLINMARG
jgi:hypothetical protein